MEIICFHNPDEANGYLSNWYLSDFIINDVRFSSAEQFMMYQKAICFGDELSAAKILSTDDAAEIKALGRQVLDYDESVWNGLNLLGYFTHDGTQAVISHIPAFYCWIHQKKAIICNTFKRIAFTEYGRTENLLEIQYAMWPCNEIKGRRSEAERIQASFF